MESSILENQHFPDFEKVWKTGKMPRFFFLQTWNKSFISEFISE